MPGFEYDYSYTVTVGDTGIVDAANVDEAEELAHEAIKQQIQDEYGVDLVEVDIDIDNIKEIQ